MRPQTFFASTGERRSFAGACAVFLRSLMGSSTRGGLGASSASTFAKTAPSPMNILNRRHFLLSSLATLAGSSRAAQPGETFSIGMMADAQYADIAPRGSRHYRESIKKLGLAKDALNAANLQFCVHLGDLIDRDWRASKSPSPPSRT